MKVKYYPALYTIKGQGGIPGAYPYKTFKDEEEAKEFFKPYVGPSSNVPEYEFIRLVTEHPHWIIEREGIK